MGIMIKPTKDRNGTYYIRKAVPQELRPAIGKGELKRSLETKDLEQAKLKAPAALAEINAIIQNARAERTVTQDDTEVIASVWMTRILQQPELIKARYVQKYDEGYGLTADNGQLSECLRKGERADEADFRLVTDYYRKVSTLSRPQLTMKIAGYGVKAKIIFDLLSVSDPSQN